MLRAVNIVSDPVSACRNSKLGSSIPVTDIELMMHRRTTMLGNNVSMPRASSMAFDAGSIVTGYIITKLIETASLTVVKKLPGGIF